MTSPQLANVTIDIDIARDRDSKSRRAQSNIYDGDFLQK